MKQLVLLSGKGGTSKTTVSGAHDLKRVLATSDHFRVPAMVVLNKVDLNLGRSDEIVAFCAARGVQVIGRIPYDTIVTQAMVVGQPATAVGGNAVAGALRGLWTSVRKTLLDS